MLIKEYKGISYTASSVSNLKEARLKYYRLIPFGYINIHILKYIPSSQKRKHGEWTWSGPRDFLFYLYDLNEFWLSWFSGTHTHTQHVNYCWWGRGEDVLLGTPRRSFLFSSCGFAINCTRWFNYLKIAKKPQGRAVSSGLFVNVFLRG